MKKVAKMKIMKMNLKITKKFDMNHLLMKKKKFLYIKKNFLVLIY